MSKNKRPNFLMIITDQQSHGAMSCAGNEYLNTPAMDSIAANGVRFENAYCANPVCIPSRIAMFSGRWPHEAGVYSNIRKAPALDEFEWLGTKMNDAGYECAYFGKWHLVVSPKKTGIHGFGELFKTTADHLVPMCCEEFFKEEHEKPFFLVASFVNPHNVCQWARGEPLPNGVIPDLPSVDECPPLPDNFEVQENEPDAPRAVKKAFKDKLYPTKDWNAKKWREYLWSYYRMVEKVDGEIGKVLASLRENGYEEDTVIIFVSDHGEGLAQHKWNQKQILYESVSHVPFIIAQKGKAKGSTVYHHIVSTGQDIFPTICDYAGIEKPGNLRGISLKGIVEGTVDTPIHEYVISETEMGTFTDEPFNHCGRPAGRMVRTSRYKYMVYSQGTIRESLIDFEQDLGEMNNLSTDPSYKSVLEKHREILETWCKETKDDFYSLD